jgi:hypothetical protein
LFRHTDINITFKPPNTIHHFLQNHLTTDKLHNSGTYRLHWNTCNRSYVGQSGRSISIRHKEHLRYIKTNNQVSAYAARTLNDQHEFAPSKQTMQLLQPCTKCNIMNQWESFYIQGLHSLNLWIEEQQPPEHNPLFTLGSFDQ